MSCCFLHCSLLSKKAGKENKEMLTSNASQNHCLIFHFIHFIHFKIFFVVQKQLPKSIFVILNIAIGGAVACGCGPPTLLATSKTAAHQLWRPNEGQKCRRIEE